MIKFDLFGKSIVHKDLQIKMNEVITTIPSQIDEFLHSCILLEFLYFYCKN